MCWAREDALLAGSEPRVSQQTEQTTYCMTRQAKSSQIKPQCNSSDAHYTGTKFTVNYRVNVMRSSGKEPTDVVLFLAF